MLQTSGLGRMLPLGSTLLISRLGLEESTKYWCVGGKIQKVKLKDKNAASKCLPRLLSITYMDDSNGSFFVARNT